MKILKNENNGGYKTVVEYNGKHYYFDLCNTSDRGNECMGFLCDSDGNVINWHEVYCKHGIDITVDELEKCVNEFIEKGECNDNV